MEVEHDVVDMDDIRGLHGRNCRGVLLPCRVSTDGYAEPGALTRCRLADLLGYRLATRPAAADGLKLLTDNRIRMEIKGARHEGTEEDRAYTVLGDKR
jgi:hypothetical protein